MIVRIVAAVWCCFFQAEDGIRDLVRSRGLGDVYKRQGQSANLPRGRNEGSATGWLVPESRHYPR